MGVSVSWSLHIKGKATGWELESTGKSSAVTQPAGKDVAKCCVVRSYDMS